jgi:hypothetical protein
MLQTALPKRRQQGTCRGVVQMAETATHALLQRRR